MYVQCRYMRMLGDCQYSSHQQEDVGSVNTMCIQVVIIVVHIVSSVSTHMCYYGLAVA